MSVNETQTGMPVFAAAREMPTASGMLLIVAAQAMSTSRLLSISKGGFFYHFKDKSALVKAILERHVAAEEVWFDGLFDRACAVDEDPLQQFLTFLRLLREDMERLPDVHPGCLIATCCFQERLFDFEVHALARQNLLTWRATIHQRLQLIAHRYPPRIDVNLQELADMLTALIDGAIILSKTVQEKEVLPRQTDLYRQFVKAVFTGA